MTNDVTIWMAFVAGILSFLSPCVLPLVPGYVSFISGVSLQEIKESHTGSALSHKKKLSVVLNAMFFVAGFSGVFILLGASATWIGALLSSKITFLTKMAGLVIIIFGLFKIGLIRPLVFFKEARFNVGDNKLGLIWAFLVGAAFAFGWTPCIGPILGGILAYAGTLEDVHKGIWLLSAYSLGLGIPFLLTALGVNQFFSFFNRIKKHLGLFEKITGIIMVILGLMIFTNTLVLIPGYLTFLNKFAL